MGFNSDGAMVGWAIRLRSPTTRKMVRSKSRIPPRVVERVVLAVSCALGLRIFHDERMVRLFFFFMTGEGCGCFFSMTSE